MRKRLGVLIAALVSLLGLGFAGAFFHTSIVPARLTARDLGMIPPVLLCIAVGRLIDDHFRRAVFGFAQAALLLYVYSNHFSRAIHLGSDSEVQAVYAVWLAWLAGYTTVFTLLTHLLGKRFRPSPAGHCSVCGYDLRGLRERRCPECGRQF